MLQLSSFIFFVFAGDCYAKSSFGLINRPKFINPPAGCQMFYHANVKCMKCSWNGEGNCDFDSCPETTVYDPTTKKCKVCGYVKGRNFTTNKWDEHYCTKCTWNGYGKCDSNGCPAGSVWSKIRQFCVAIEECEVDPPPCPAKSICFNYWNHAECVCYAGYAMNADNTECVAATPAPEAEGIGATTPWPAPEAEGYGTTTPWPAPYVEENGGSTVIYW